MDLGGWCRCSGHIRGVQGRRFHRLFTDFLARSPLSAGPPPAPATPASTHERGGGIGARLMHRVCAELQGEHDGRVRGVQGQALLMSGGGWYERPGCVRLLAVTSVTGGRWVTWGVRWPYSLCCASGKRPSWVSGGHLILGRRVRFPYTSDFMVTSVTVVCAFTVRGGR